MFYILKENKIINFNEDKNTLKSTLAFLPELSEDDIFETEKEIISIKGVNYFSDDEALIDAVKEKRKQEILEALDALDLKSIRAIRANDTEYIEQYETEAEALREELRNL